MLQRKSNSKGYHGECRRRGRVGWAGVWDIIDTCKLSVPDDD